MLQPVRAPSIRSSARYRAGEVSNRCRDRAHITMQRQLDPPTEAGPVDHGNSRIRQGPDSSEQLMTGAAPLARRLGRAAHRELLEVCPGREEIRLAGDHE